MKGFDPVSFDHNSALRNQAGQACNASLAETGCRELTPVAAKTTYERADEFGVSMSQHISAHTPAIETSSGDEYLSIEGCLNARAEKALRATKRVRADAITKELKIDRSTDF